MRRTRRLLTLAAAAASWLVVTAASAPSAYATSADVSDVVLNGANVQLLLTAKGLPADATVDPSRLTVSVAGQLVPARVDPVGGLKTAVTRTTVLLVDTSGSMAGAGIAGARTAAKAFLADVAADVRVGLVAFSDSASVLVAPTRDRAAVRAGLGQLNANGNTRLYDALLTAERQLQGGGERHLLLLSDGADTSSAATVTQVISKLKADHVQLDAVAFRTQPATNDPLQQLASATAGTVYQAADVKQLAAAFAHVAHDYDQKLMVAFAVPAGLRDHKVDVALSLPTSAGLLTAHAGLDAPAAETPVASVSPPGPSASPAAGPSASANPSLAAASGLPGAVPPKAAQPQKGSPLTRQSMVTAAVAVGVGLFLLLLLAFDVGSASLGRMRTLRRIARFTLGKLDKPERVVEATTGTGLRHSPIARTAVQVAGRVVERRDPEQKLRLLLDRAGIPLLPSEWLLVLAGSAAVGTVLVSVASRSAWVGLLAGGVVGGAVPHVIARVKARRRMDAFLAALPDALQMTAGSLATGYSLPQALDAIVRQGGDPMATEVGRALAQARLGIPLEDALQELAERMQCRDFEWVVMAIRINRDVGGSLSDVLSTVARTLREREQLRRHVRGLSAEGRLSAYILVGLPLVVAGFLFSFRRAYIRPLYTEPAGIVMLAGAVTLVLIGAVWMRSLVKVEV